MVVVAGGHQVQHRELFTNAPEPIMEVKTMASRRGGPQNVFKGLGSPQSEVM